MTGVTNLKARITGRAQAEAARYSDGHDRPLRGYVLTLGTYGGVLGGIAGIVKLTGRPLPARVQTSDIVLGGAATHKLSRLLAKDPVTSPIRAPFAAYKGQQGPAELAEDVRGSGTQHAVGELLTCPFCMGMWIATGFAAGLIFVPRTTRLVMSTLTVVATSDLLQFVYAWLEQAAG